MKHVALYHLAADHQLAEKGGGFGDLYLKAVSQALPKPDCGRWADSADPGRDPMGFFNGPADEHSFKKPFSFVNMELNLVFLQSTSRLPWPLFCYKFISKHGFILTIFLRF